MTDNIYWRALDILRDGGWARTVRENIHGRHCLVGAIEKAKYGKCAVRLSDRGVSPYNEPEVRHIEQIIENEYHFKSADWFNDSPDTTQADVERVLEKAAIQADELV